MSAPMACRLANRRVLFQSISTIRSQTSHLPYRLGQRSTQIRPSSRYAAQHHLEELRGTGRNPMDNISVDPVRAAKRAKDIRYMKFCAFGLVCCIGALFVLVPQLPRAPQQNSSDENIAGKGSGVFPRTSLDTPEKDAKEFQGKPVVVIAGGQRVVARDTDTGQEVELVKTGTSTIPHFPKTIQLPSSSPGDIPADNEYTLLGLGVRTVSLFSIEVYVVGLYVQTSSLAALQARMVKYINPLGSALIAGEKDELRSALLDGDRSHILWDQLLSEEDLDLKTVFRVVPVKNTDFGHLRDGWVRGITSRIQAAQKIGDDRFSDDSFGLAMKDFKGLMAGKGKAPTGSVILLARDANGALELLYQAKDGKVDSFGNLKDERIARLVWLGYLGGKNVSSEGARQSVVNGIMELVERPIGTVETKVG